MDLQAPPDDAVGRAVGCGGTGAPPCAGRATKPSRGAAMVTPLGAVPAAPTRSTAPWREASLSAAPTPAAPSGATPSPGAPLDAVPSPATPSLAAGDPVSAWGQVGAAADAVAVAGAGLWRCTDEQLVDLLRAQADDLARIEAARLGLVRELDARGWAARVGAASTQAWLAHALRVDPRAAAADVRAARALDPAGDIPPEVGAPVMTGARTSADGPVLAATGRALAGGELSRAHADAVLASVRALPPLPANATDGAESWEELIGRAEAWLLQQCGQF